MIQFAKKLVHHRKFIVFLAFILLIPSTIGIVKTRINYDILSYLPDSLETVKGQDIMVDQFGAGAYSMIIVEDMNLHDVQKLKQKLEKVDHVDKIIWYDDIADLSVPKEMLPEKVRKVFFNKNATMMIAMFKETTSSDNTMEAVTQMRKIVGKQCFISGYRYQEPGYAGDSNLRYDRSSTFTDRIICYDGILCGCLFIPVKYRNGDPL